MIGADSAFAIVISSNNGNCIDSIYYIGFKRLDGNEMMRIRELVGRFGKHAELMDAEVATTLSFGTILHNIRNSYEGG